MPEPLSPLACSHVGAATMSSSRLTLEESRLGYLWQIAGWNDFADATTPVLNALGFSDLGDYRHVQTSTAKVLCYRIAPDKIWLRDTAAMADIADIANIAGATNANRAIQLGDTQRLAVLSLSHSRCVISVCGAACEDVMARVAALDFSEAAFPERNFAQTSVHQVSVLIHRAQQDRFDILTPVSWAASVWEWLFINASPYLE